MAQGIVLIIDDDVDITEAMKIVLENDGYTVETAEDSEAGMRQLQSAKPGLIILDVMMNTPREGFMFSRQLKKNPQYKDIPILMLTSVKEKTGIDFKEAAGDEEWLPVEEFLDKPVKPDELLDKVRNLLKK
ncbi:MAG: response regulator [Sedimentisphaerales bacterium]|nr:response regulator [Sedimentisphaerales bacterium]